MTIPPTPMHNTLIGGPGAWRRAAFADPPDWRRPLSPETFAELEQALQTIRDQRRDLPSLTSAEFALPAFDAQAVELRREILSGRGFVVLHGLPIERCTAEEAEMLYWCLGSRLGPPLPQNLAGDRLYSVRNEGYSIEQDYGATGVRYSKTSEGFHFHTDSAPALAGITPVIVGLIALQTAKSGGASVLVSAKSVHDVMLAERPDLLALLYAPFHHDRSSELPPGESPTLLAPIFRFDGQLRMRYMRFYIEQGHRKAAAPLSSGQIEALDFLDSVMDREGLHILFDLNRGEMLFVSNEFILHSRTAFEDHPEPARRRHYARLWLGRETPIRPAAPTA